MKKEEIDEIFRDHKDWLLTHGDDGKRAVLRGVDLYKENLIDVDLRGATLCKSDLRGADLSSANLSEADLREVDFSKADLRGADLSGVDFYGAKIKNAILHGAFLPKGIYAVGGAGSEQRYTYYDSINDCIVCGCWDDYNGNHLESFKKRIEDVYGSDAKSPNPKHYKAYQAAIHYFEACRDAYMSEY